MRSISIILIISILNGYVWSQNFKWESNLDKVASNGFYSIILNPDITGKLKDDFSDIRIYDNKNDEVPYLFKSEIATQYTQLFKEYKILEIKHLHFWDHTRIVLHNPKKDNITNINLVIRNTEVSKWLKLSGSDDNKNWYIIKSNYYFQSMFSDTGTSMIQILNFPISNYEYYEISINDFFNNPINVAKAGYFDTKVEKGKYTQTSEPSIIQSDTSELKKSIVIIKFSEVQYIDKIEFEIDGPEYYFREADLSVTDSMAYKKNKPKYYHRVVNSFDLSSSLDNTVFFNQLKLKEARITIINNDDKPIKIKSVKAYQLNKYLIAHLERDKEYFIRFGNKEVMAPVYDILYFQDKIPANVTQVSTGKLMNLSTGEGSVRKSTKTIFIWLAIIGVIALLGFMTYKMINDMKKKPGSDVH